jgi:acyl carrier protein
MPDWSICAMRCAWNGSCGYNAEALPRCLMDRPSDAPNVVRWAAIIFGSEQVQRGIRISEFSGPSPPWADFVAVRPFRREFIRRPLAERGVDGRQEVLPMTETARVLVLDTIRQQVHKFVMYNFLYDGVSADIDDDASLLEIGVIDATGILELTLFVEDIFGVRVPEADLVPENFDSVNNIARYIARNYVAS